MATIFALPLRGAFLDWSLLVLVLFTSQRLLSPLQALAGGGAHVLGAQTQGPAAAPSSTPASFAVNVTYSLSYAQPTAGIQSHHSHFPSLAGAASSAGSAFGRLDFAFGALHVNFVPLRTLLIRVITRLLCTVNIYCRLYKGSRCLQVRLEAAPMRSVWELWARVARVRSPVPVRAPRRSAGWARRSLSAQTPQRRRTSALSRRPASRPPASTTRSRRQAALVPPRTTTTHRQWATRPPPCSFSASPPTPTTSPRRPPIASARPTPSPPQVPRQQVQYCTSRNLTSRRVNNSNLCPNIFTSKITFHTVLSTVHPYTLYIVVVSSF